MTIGAFALYIFLTAFTPGPNNIMAMSNAGQYGFRGALPFCLGVFLGFLIVMSTCAVLGSLLFAYLPEVEPILRVVGTAYIIWLAWTIWRSSTDSRPLSKSPGLTAGLILQLVNVKVILYGITALSVFVLPFYSGGLQLAAFVLILSLVGTAGTMSWAGFGAMLQNLFQKHRRLVNGFLAMSLVITALIGFAD
ncbi:lysine transporter LysE [Deltaproteobacteria bacterium Smac51]|nr:lysine transporter LysE [Deltaproteobacteria bacterium Smac51]